MMKKTIILILFCLVFFPTDALARPQHVYRQSMVRLYMEHPGSGYTGQWYTLKVIGLDGRPLYGANVRIFLNESFIVEGISDRNGIFKFKPPRSGVYGWNIRSGRYFAMGGDIKITNPPGYKGDNDQIRSSKTFES